MASEKSNTPGQEGSQAGKRIALVVGSNGQPQPGRHALNYASSSAQAVAQALRDHCGFELLQPPLLDEHATTDNTRKAIYALVKGRRANDFLLFYFCGHGEPLFIDAEQRDVYLVTQDFDPDHVQTDREAHISFNWLRRILYENSNVQAGTVLIFLDCCYAGNAGYQREEQPLEDLKQSIERCFRHYLGEPENQRGIRITIAAASYNGTTFEEDGYTVLAKHLLPALRGECPPSVNDLGQLSYERLAAYLRECLPISTSNKPLNEPVIIATFPHLTLQARQARGQAEWQRADEQKLLALSKHEFSRTWLQDRLDSFVGRESELNELRQKITAMLKTGGYLAITGVAGQGKSSIIAKLVDLYRTNRNQECEGQVIHHFIPFDPGTGYQVILLKHLMACLILKYHLQYHRRTFYIESESLPTLRGLFRPLLEEVVKQGGQEIIFIDGLDQLPEDASGMRDVNLLASGDPPEGIVFVLGTRPNALRSLKLHKPFQEYPLPNLSLHDFKLILQHRMQARPGSAEPLESHLIETMYNKLEANALFLDLAAKELVEHTDITPDEIIRRISDNPENLFSLAMDRLGRNIPAPDTPWKRVIKPVLGVLLTAREPVERTHLKQIINVKHRRDARPPVDGEELDGGLERLKGLIVQDMQNGLQCYSLFHLKFRDYLRRDETQPHKDYLFDADDEQDWHSILATWCEHSQLDRIWQDATYDASEQRRRLYARQHYITHLYHAGQPGWQRLFEVLDEGSYGKKKVQFDVSTRLYALDLELGQKAAASIRWNYDEAVHLLPNLWRYTLLRASLASKADKYPQAAFQVMLLLGQERKALGLAELLTRAAYKAEIFLLIATHFFTLPERDIEAQQLVIRTQEIELTIQDRDEQGQALSEFAQALAQAQRFEQAQQVIQSIQDRDEQGRALSQFAQALAQAQRFEQAQRVWEQAQQVIQSIQDRDKQGEALCQFAQALAQSDEYERLVSLVHHWWLDVKEREEAIRRLSLASQFISHHPELGITFFDAFAWVDDFLQG